MRHIVGVDSRMEVVVRDLLQWLIFVVVRMRAQVDNAVAALPVSDAGFLSPCQVDCLPRLWRIDLVL